MVPSQTVVFYVSCVVATMILASTPVHSLPLNSDDEAGYRDFKNLLTQAVLSDLQDASNPDPPLAHTHAHTHFFRQHAPQTPPGMDWDTPTGPPTDTPSLADLMRSALAMRGQIQRELNDVGILHVNPLPPQLPQGARLSLKRAVQGGLLALRRGWGLGVDSAEEEEGVPRKRGFDSISSSSSFGGMNRGSWGGSRANGENLQFTFESLFPAIARSLRSSN